MACFEESPAHYDRVTETWSFLLGEDLHLGYFEDPNHPLAEATAALTRLMAEQARIDAGMEVLDIGCGNGGPATYLARNYRCRVTGITDSPVGLAHARERLGKNGISKLVQFQCADGTALHFRDGTFDRVWIMETAHLVADKEALLREAARVLRPGGRLAMCDVIVRRPLRYDEVLRSARSLTAIQQAFGRSKAESADLYAGILSRLGMTASCLDISEHVRPTFRHWQDSAEQHAARVTELLGAHGLEQFVGACHAMESLWQDGRLGYAIVTADKA